MAYCSITDLTNAVSEDDVLIPLSSEEVAPSEVDEGIVNACIAIADNLIDGFLRGRYSLPLSSTPEIVKNISIDISIYRLYFRRPEIETPEKILLAYKYAMDQLKLIQSGKLVLDIDGDGEADQGGGREYKTNKTSSSRIYNSTLWDKYLA